MSNQAKALLVGLPAVAFFLFLAFVMARYDAGSQAAHEALEITIGVLTGAFVLIMLAILALTVPRAIEAWRTQENRPTIEKHYVREKHIIDSRPAVQAPQPWPALPEPNMAIFPAMIEAAWRQGMLEAGERGEVVDAEEVREAPAPMTRPRVWH